MANYSTNLKTWGDNGVEYPDGYSYLEGEQPVDDWDNFFNAKVIDDLKHLVSLTNSRIESGYGTNASLPASGEDGEFYYDTDNEEVRFWKATSASWGKFLDATGDTMVGNLDMGGNQLTAVSKITGSNGTSRLDFESDRTQIKDDVGAKLLDGLSGTRRRLYISDTEPFDIFNATTSAPVLSVTPGGQLSVISADIASTQLTEDGSGNPDINLDGNGSISRFGSSQLSFYSGRVEINNELWPDGIRMRSGDLDMDGSTLTDNDGTISANVGFSTTSGNIRAQDGSLWASESLALDDAGRGSYFTGYRGRIYLTQDAGGSYPFNGFGNLVIEGRKSYGDIVFANDDGSGSGTRPVFSLKEDGDAYLHDGNLDIPNGSLSVAGRTVVDSSGKSPLSVASATDDGSDLTDLTLEGPGNLVSTTGSGTFQGGVVHGNTGNNSGVVGARITVDGGTSYDITMVKYSDGSNWQGVAFLPPIRFESSLTIEIDPTSSISDVGASGSLKQ